MAGLPLPRFPRPGPTQVKKTLTRTVAGLILWPSASTPLSSSAMPPHALGDDMEVPDYVIYAWVGGGVCGWVGWMGGWVSG